MPPPATSSEPAPERRTCLGLLQRRSVWFPTRRGWLVLVLVAALVIVTFLRGSYPFLAVNAPVRDGVMVVEGWISDHALEEAVAEFKRHPYERLYVTGGPLDKGFYLSEYKTYAELGAATLKKLGVPDNKLDAVAAPLVPQDRTYASAVALRDWLKEHGRSHPRLHVFSDGPHARRTRLLFQKAMGDGVTVGISAAQDRNYDPKRWWASSYGVRAIVDEWVAYGYARLLFWPKS